MIKLFNWFRRKKSVSVENQGAVNDLISEVSKESFIDFLLGRGQTKLAAHVINQYYKTCAPLSDAVDKLSGKTATIDPSVWDNAKDDWDNKHPLLALLKKPNMLETYEDFMERAASLFTLHGEVFLISVGRVDKPPREIFAASPSAITFEINQSDGFIETMKVQDGISQTTYYRHEVKGRFRYYDVIEKSDLSLSSKEIIQLKHFNPDGSLIPIHGQSVLQSLYFEIEQWLASGKHNLSVLMRGATLSGIITTDENLGGLTEDQREALGQKLDNFMSGSENAGRVALFDNGLKFMSTTQTNKDMDFRVLKKDLRVDIYNRLDIPLPMVNEDTMTMANRESAQIQLFQNAVQPLTDRLYSYITLFVMYRYDDSEQKELKVDTSNIPALEPLKIDNATKLISNGIITRNEARRIFDYEDLKQGGDFIYGSASDMPIAGNEDFSTNNADNSNDQDDQDDQDDEQKIATRDEFVKFMRNQRDSKGKRKFTDERINEIADRENLK